MSKVFVLAPRENWICDRIVSEWYQYFPKVSTKNPIEADVIWMLAGWCWNHLNLDLLRSKKVICTEHHIVPSKFDQQSFNRFKFRDQFVDHYHVPNNHTAEIVRQLTEKPVTVIGYWYDPQKWFPGDRKKARSDLGLDRDKFIIGSFQRDSEGETSNPKLEKGPDLFCNYVEKISKERDVHVLLGGWRRKYVVNRLSDSNIEFTLRELETDDNLRLMYLSCDLYVVSSRQEGGPQALLESPATLTPIVTTNVGISRDTVNNNCIIDIEKDIYYPDDKDVKENSKKIEKFKIQDHGLNYVDFINRIRNNG